MLSNRSFCVLLVLLSLMWVTAVLGQTSRGGISGSVADPSGAMVTGAAVKLEQAGTGLTGDTVTTNAGLFSFADLQPGTYTVTVSVPGFTTQRIQQVRVEVGKTTSLPVNLSLASAVQIVEITAAAATLETNQSALNSVVSSREIAAAPLNGRDYRQLLQLTPGYNIQSSQNGNRANQNNWQIDGVDNNDFWHNSEAVNQGSISGLAGVLLPIDAVEEFNQQSVGGADYGRNPGSMVNVVIKSGNNMLHGSAYYFHRNDAFAKPNPFLPADAPSKLRNHNFGFSVGGPIVKDKAFFFLSMEGQRFIAGNAIQATVPSAAWVAQATTLLNNNNVPVNPVMVATLNNLWPSAITSAPGTPLNFSSTDPNNYKSNNGVARIDWAINSTQRLFLRSFIGSGDATAYAGSVYGEYFQAVPSRQQNWALVLNSTLTHRMVNQVLFGVNYFLQNFDDARHDQNPPSWGFNTGVGPESLGSPNIEINGFNHGGVGETPGLGRTDTTWHVADDLGYTVGGHNLKFGGEFRRAKLFVHYLRNMRGAFLFDGTVGPWAPTSGAPTPEESLADFLAGFIAATNGGIATGDPRRDYYVNSMYGYAQDNWQVSPRLNVTLGLRYEYNGALYDPTHTISTFLPGATSLLNGLAYPGQSGSPIDSLYPTDKNNFAPRLGFAFTPQRGGKTVIRGAWGMYYDIPNGNLIIDNRARPGGRGVSRNPGPANLNPVFDLSNPDPITVDPNGTAPIFGSVTPVPPFTAYGIDQKLRSPYVQNFSLNVQRQLTSNVLFQVGYVGSQGRKLIVDRNINLPPPSPTAYTDFQAARPFNNDFPNLAGITQISSIGDSNYNSLQTLVRSTSWHGLSGQLAYTWSHALDDLSTPRNNRPTDNNNLKLDYGNADFDARHNVSGYVLYDIPQFSKSLPRLTKGWELSALVAYNSGFPFTVYSGLGSTATGSHTGNTLDRANLVGDPFSGIVQPANPPGLLTGGVQWINPDAFADNAPGTFGNTRRNQFLGPRFKTIDFAVIKNTAITERVSAQFRVEMFNVFNTLNLAPPGGDSPVATQAPAATRITDGIGSFGVITSTLHQPDSPGLGAGEPFNVQFALKIIF
jgi:Carboxypeptidase regulatory-like domain